MSVPRDEMLVTPPKLPRKMHVKSKTLSSPIQSPTLSAIDEVRLQAIEQQAQLTLEKIEIERQKATILKDLQELTGEMESQYTKNSDLSQTNHTLKRHVKLLKLQIASLDDELSVMKDELLLAHEDTELTKQSMDIINIRNIDHAESLQLKLQVKEEEISTIIARLQADINIRNKEIAYASVLVEEVDKKHLRLEGDCYVLNEKNEELQAKISELNDTVKSANERFYEDALTIEVLLGKEGDHLDRINELEIDKKCLEGQLEAYIKSHNELEHELADAIKVASPKLLAELYEQPELTPARHAEPEPHSELFSDIIGRLQNISDLLTLGPKIRPNNRLPALLTGYNALKAAYTGSGFNTPPVSPVSLLRAKF